MTQKHRLKIDKLIRDKLPNIIRTKGAEVDERAMEIEEYTKRLKDKLIEEAMEVAAATAEDNLIEELADVFEVLHAISNVSGISHQQIESRRIEKRKRNGAFEKRLYASYVEIDADHPEIEYYLARKEKYTDI